MSKSVAYFKAAEQEALKSGFRIRMGAVVVYKGRIIGRGCNVLKSHPMVHKPGNFFRCIHAEIAACLNGPRDLQGADVWVARLFKNGEYALAKPCEACDELLVRFKVKRAFYTIDNTKFGEVRYNGQGFPRHRCA